MKKILITGENSYIGNSFLSWMEQYEKDYKIFKIGLRDDTWINKDFSEYDCIIHLAAIVHKKGKRDYDLYNKINTDLSYKVAMKAKNEGVAQFIYFSSMSVYGLTTGEINKNTKCKPNTPYGRSKYDAEKKISSLVDSEFTVAIVRPPMVYGINSKGNYTKLSRLSKSLKLFPKFNNERSMIYIENLCCFLKILIDFTLGGTFCPQNKDYVCTYELVNEIARLSKSKLILLNIFNPTIRLIMPFSLILQKILGDLKYEKNLSQITDLDNNILDYNKVDFKSSIYKSEVPYE